MREAWEEEILARHRWGRHSKDRATEELLRLKKFWETAQPLDEACKDVMGQVIAIEICNWNLEESILALCAAIGAKEPTKQAIGHMASVTEERWKKVWAYYLTLQDWLPCETRCGYQTLLKICDSDKTIQNHISSLLGQRNRLKELYVERLALCLGFWLGGYFPRESMQGKVHTAAVSAVEAEIKKLDPETRILDAMKLEGDGRLQPCNHKAFRRYDIIISSIGAGKWRAVMPMRGIDGFERADTLEEFLSPIEAWTNTRPKPEKYKEAELFDRIHELLGERDNAKVFLASLLVSLLRAQQLTARKWAKKRRISRKSVLT